jgi:DNA polymerase-3 subunit alpha
MAALMTSEEDKHDHLALFIKEARKMNATNSDKRIKVLPPDINLSEPEFTADKDGNIRYGLSAIKGVGKNVAEIVSQTEINDIYDLFSIPEVNAKAVEAFACSGALKNITYSVASVLAGFPDALKSAQKNRRNTQQISIFDTDDFDEFRPTLPEVPELPKDTLLSHEKEYLGTYITGHPLKSYMTFIKSNTNFTVETFVENKTGYIAGMITNVKPHFTKKGDRMAFISVDDVNDEAFDAVVFPRTYLAFKEHIAEGKIVVLEGRYSDESFIVDKVFDIEDFKSLKNVVQEQKGKELRVRCDFDTFKKVQLSLNKYTKGNVPVRWYNLDGKSRLLIQKTSYDKLLLMELQEIVGEDNAKYVF